MIILVVNRGNEWKAWIEDDPQKHAFGANKDEAVGKLVSDYQKVFILTVKEL